VYRFYHHRQQQQPGCILEVRLVIIDDRCVALKRLRRTAAEATGASIIDRLPGWPAMVTLSGFPPKAAMF